MAQIAYIDQLPAITAGMIRTLPSYTITEPISLGGFIAIKAPNARNPNMRVGDIIEKIQSNIRLIKDKTKRDQLEESLDIQLAIIEHGYGGVCPNDYAANQIAQSLLKSGYKPRFEI